MTRLRPRRILPSLVTLVAALALAPSASAAQTLYATVGPEFTISLTTPRGVAVGTLASGRQYFIVVRDRSDLHNFHLRGTGVNLASRLEFTEVRRWRLTFRSGTYTFLCDAHPQGMQGSFRVRPAPES